MKTWEEQGGPAFPVPDSRALHVEEGMSLRDYFAAKALQGVLADHTRDLYPHEFAKIAYTMADAMLAEREQ